MKSSDVRIVVQPAHLREESTPQASKHNSPCGSLKRRLREESCRNLNTISRSREYVSVLYLTYMTVDIAVSGLWRFAHTEEICLRCSTVVCFPLKCAYVCRDCLLGTDCCMRVYISDHWQGIRDRMTTYRVCDSSSCHDCSLSLTHSFVKRSVISQVVRHGIPHNYEWKKMN